MIGCNFFRNRINVIFYEDLLYFQSIYSHRRNEIFSQSRICIYFIILPITIGIGIVRIGSK